MNNPSEDIFLITLKIGDFLIPGDPRTGLTSLGEIIASKWDSDPDFQELAGSFLQGYCVYLGHKCTLEDVDETTLKEYISKRNDPNISFLSSVLEMYYTHPNVKEYYPDFANKVFPEFRKMPLDSFESLQFVFENNKVKPS